MAKIDESCVGRLFRECVLGKHEQEPRPVHADGIRCAARFHPKRLTSQAQKVEELLKMLPRAFRASQGGAQPFEGFSKDHEGVSWTKNLRPMQELLLLALATGKATLVPIRGYQPTVTIHV